MKNICLLVLFAILFSSEALSQTANSIQRKVAILDLTSRNNEIDSARVWSARHIMQVSGIPFIETTNLNIAIEHNVLFIAPRIYSSTFTVEEENSLRNFVSSGGTLIASNSSASELNDLFGITDYTTDNLTKRFIWNSASSYVDRIEDYNEIHVSLGDTTDTNVIFNHKYYTPAVNAEVLATYENNFAALVKNEYGLGRTFLFGVDFKDVVLRNLINNDYAANRFYSNYFEPATDTFIFFITNICRKHIPACVRWHTCPTCDNAVFMLTHDIDSRTAVDTMAIFLEYEESQNIHTMYNQTTRYMNDDWMSDFYNNNTSTVNNVLVHGQRLASHSVGHFPDFNEDYVSIGDFGNTNDNYQPFYSAETGVTEGATVFGECEVSKNILESDYGVTVKSFRAGHLCYNKRLPSVLDDLGYLYNSTFSANDVLTNFPFFDIDELRFGGRKTNVIEIPLTISDASATFPFNLDTYPSKIVRWKMVTLKNVANNAPTVLLIHPNRTYKLTAQQNFFSQLPEGINYMFLDDFGDYWRDRLHSRLNSEYNSVDSTLNVYLNDFDSNKDYSVIIDNYSDSSHCHFFDGNSIPLYPCKMEVNFGETRFCNFQYQDVADNDCVSEINHISDTDSNNRLQIYPNPTTGIINIEMNSNYIGKTLRMIDLTGKIIFEKTLLSEFEKIDCSKFSPGIYLFNIDHLIQRVVIN